MTPESPASPAPPAPRRKFRWVPTALLLALALSGWGAAFVVYTRNKQSESPSGPGAVVVFHIARTPPAVLPERGAADAAEFESYRNAQSALVRRRLTLNAVLKQPGVANLGVVRAQADPLAWLEDNLRVSFGPAEIMRVEIDGEPVEELRIILEALAKVYLADIDERENGARRVRLQRLEETNRGYTAEVERLRKRLDTVARALGSMSPEILVIMGAYLKDEFRAALRELADIRNQLQLLEAEKGGDGPEAKQLARREALVKARVDDIRKQIENSSEYRLELENLKSLIGQTEKLSGSLGEAIERLKIELGAPPRVTLADEAHARRPR
jgi:hypothetical protein